MARCLYLWHLLLISAVSSPVLAFQVTPPKANNQQPVVLIVVSQVYEDQRLKELQFPAKSAILFATAMANNGYQIRLVTEKATLGQLKDGLPQLSEQAFVEANDAASVIKAVNEWKGEYFQTAHPAPFGFCALTGHGEERTANIGSDTFFMTHKDKPAVGGVSIRDLQDIFGIDRLPIVLIVDTCRMGPAVVTPTPPRIVNGDDLSELEILALESRQSRYKTPRKYPGRAKSSVTTIWATQIGQRAADQYDLLSALAAGLKDGRNGTSFKARDFRVALRDFRAADVSPLEGPADLSLLTWFHYAVMEVSASNENRQICQVDEGSIDQTMLCASKISRRDLQKPALNFVHYLQKFTDVGLLGEPVPEGVKVYRPKEANPMNLIATAYFTRKMEWQGRTLLVELTAVNPHAKPDDMLACLIIPGDNRNGGRLSLNCDTPHRLAYQQTVQLAIPLSDTPFNQERNLPPDFTSLTISAVSGETHLWPVGAGVIISRLLLVETETWVAVKGQAPAVGSIDLPSRWWVSDDIPAKSTKAKIRATRAFSEDNDRVLQFEFAGVAPGEILGKGGPIHFPPWIDFRRHRLEVTLGKVVKGNHQAVPKLELIAIHGDQSILEQEIRLDANEKQVLRFARDGAVEYMSLLCQNITSVEVIKIEIVEDN